MLGDALALGLVYTGNTSIRTRNVCFTLHSLVRGDGREAIMDCAKNSGSFWSGIGGTNMNKSRAYALNAVVGYVKYELGSRQRTYGAQGTYSACLVSKR